MKLTKEDIGEYTIFYDGYPDEKGKAIKLNRLREVVEELKDYTTPSEVCDCDVVDSIWASKIIRLFGEVLK